MIPLVFKLCALYKNVNYKKKNIPLSAIDSIKKNKSSRDYIEKQIRFMHYKKKLKNFIIW